MLQVKFRGRRPNGEWVEGAYIPAEHTQLGYASILTKYQRFEVDPETVEICVEEKSNFRKITASPKALAEFLVNVSIASWGGRTPVYRVCEIVAENMFYKDHPEEVPVLKWLQEERHESDT